MLSQEQLIGYLEGTLSAAERAQVEALLADDPAAQQQLAEQQSLDQALHVLLGDATSNERVKQSILAVVRAAPAERLKARVLEDTAAAQPTGVGASARWIANLLERARGTWAAWGPQGVRAWELVRRLSATPARRGAVATVSAALVLAAGFFWLKPSPAPVEIGKFISVMGAPKVQHRGERSTLNPRPSTVVYLGDRIETGDADKAEIQFNDGTTLRMNFNTALEIPNPKSEIQNPKSQLLRPTEVNLLLGKIWCKVEKATNQTQFAVHMSVATAVVRGTEFGLRLQRGSVSTNPQSAILNPQAASPLVAVLAVQEGVVDFFNSFGKVQAKAMTESVAQAGAAPTEPKRLRELKTFRLTGIHEWVAKTSRLKLTEEVERLVFPVGWVGLSVKDVKFEQSFQADGQLPAPQHVRVVRVIRDSPAEKAWLQVGDVITKVDGHAVTNSADVHAAVVTRTQAAIMLTLWRSGAEQTVTLAPTSPPDAPPMPAQSLETQSALYAATRLLIEGKTDGANAALERLLDTAARAAAHNNLGVLHETRDELGEALCHYEQAVSSAPQEALYHFNLGATLRNIGNFERAAQELKRAVELSPHWVRAREELARIYTFLNRYDDALKLADEALGRSPQSPEAWLTRHEVLMVRHRTEEARQAVLKAVGAEPTYPAAYAALGDVYYDVREFEQAEKMLRKAIELDPTQPSYYATLANVCRDQGKNDEAEKLLQRALKLNPEDADAYINLGGLHERRGQVEEAEKLYRKAIELDPDSPVPYARLGWLNVYRGRYEETEKLFLKAIELSPSDAGMYAVLGDFYQKHRRFDESEKMYLKAAELEPDSPWALVNLAASYRARGHGEEAYRLCRKALEANPTDPWIYHGFAWMLYGGHRYEEAIAMWSKARELAPDLWLPYRGMGKAYYHQGRLDQALESYRKALEWAPESAGLHVWIGDVYADRRQFEAAEEWYRKAEQLDAKEPLVYPSWAACLYEWGDLNRAEQMALKIPESDPGFPHREKMLAMICQKQGKPDEAENIYRQLLEKNPEDFGIHWRLAQLLADRGTKLDEALSLAQRAAQADPQRVDFLGTLGWVHCQRGELVEAETALKKAIETSGQRIRWAIPCWQHLGQVYEKKGERQSAIEAYHKALSLQPDSKEAAEALQRLGQ
jgi:tetratricopeptide (TPR) repeat protein